MTGGRMRRVDEAMREVLGGAITSELKDPRVGFVTVTAVETAADRPGQPQVALYLLAEGRFTAEVQKAFTGSVIAAPIGAHPALIRLILSRYDAVANPRD